MPRLHVITTEKTEDALLRAVLGARPSAARKAAAAEALRRANPSLDLSALTAGTVVVVPTIEGARRDGNSNDSDLVGEAATSALDAASAGIDALLTATKEGERERRLERKEAEELFDSEGVRELQQRVPELEENIASVRREFERDEAVSEEQRAALAEAAEQWRAELEQLRGLL